MTFLPEELEQITIDGLLEGESAYVVPWAMWADSERTLYINGNYSAHFQAGGTVHMRITRRGDVIEVDRHTIGDHRYTPGPSGFVGGDVRAIPVRLVG